MSHTRSHRHARTVRKVPYGYADQNPARTRLLRSITDSFNDSQGVTVEVTAPDTANTQFGVRHQLGRKPEEIVIVRQDKAGSIYRSNVHLWSTDIVFLKYDQAGGRLLLRLR